MANDTEHQRNKAASGSKQSTPSGGGDAVQSAQEWGGGSKGSKGPVTQDDESNPSSRARS
ncbi:hypothetical protein [Benzoatithermus flavus]|uniref:Uncharacterized protein n=1 Tax=Benzoatithermus flavus TaxID=3108223 RepID=A0ABU8XSX9_9PROT